MTNLYRVLNNQSLTDIAVQELGSALAVVDLALANDLSPTALLHPGQLLIIPGSEYLQKKVVEFFKARGLTVATLQTEQQSNQFTNLIPGVFPLTF